MAQIVHGLLLRLKVVFQKRRLDRDMADELAFHQAMLRDRLLRRGVPEAEVAAATRRTFGNALRWHERLRELWQFRRLENLLRDVSFSARVLRKSPGFTAVALLTLALGVGANTTVFSMINGLLLRPLPVPESNRLAVVGISDGGPRLNYSLSEPLFRGLENRHQVFSKLFAFNHAKLNVQGGSGSEEVEGQLVSGDFFSTLETVPILGRTLNSADDRRGGDPAGFGAVISEGFWRRWFSGAPNVIGQKLRIDNTLFTVVGVMPKRFIGADPLDRPEVFIPLATEPVIHGTRSMTAAGFHAWWLTVMGRLKPDATVEQANAEVGASSIAVLHEVIPDQGWVADREKRHFHFIVEPGGAGFTDIRLTFRKPLMVVFAICGGILLLACLNLASLLMARGAARQKELATRLAMGATRRRLVQQLLVESLLIATLGTIGGLAIAPLVSQSLTAVLLGGRGESHVDTSLDIRVFGFAALAAVVASILVGLLPALHATSANLSEQIKHGQHTTQAHERQRLLPRAMMAAEVALALMLVVSAGLLASSLVRLYKSGTGFDPSGLHNIELNMDQQPLKGHALMQFYREMGDNLSHQPGVRSVSFAIMSPFSHFVWDGNFSGPAGKSFNTYENSIAPGYFETMRIPIIAGRGFAWGDTIANGPKVILNQTAARLLLPDRNPIGETVSGQEGNGPRRYQVIGMVGDAKYDDMRSPAPLTAYLPMIQDEAVHSRSYLTVMRIDGPAGPVADAAREWVKRVNPSIPMPTMTSMSVAVEDSLSAERTMSMLSVFFAACALGVTAVGLYGTLAYATARRTNEIGIRMALGARRAQVVAMIFLQNATVACAGTTAGVVAALLASRALSSFLYGTSARDPLVFAGSILVLAMIASAASLLPAVRAARIEPMTVIRCE